MTTRRHSGDKLPFNDVNILNVFARCDVDHTNLFTAASNSQLQITEVQFVFLDKFHRRDKHSPKPSF
jgi:hypothetical protein